jgi:hypothetical protein
MQRLRFIAMQDAEQQFQDIGALIGFKNRPAIDAEAPARGALADLEHMFTAAQMPRLALTVCGGVCFKGHMLRFWFLVLGRRESQIRSKRRGPLPRRFSFDLSELSGFRASGDFRQRSHQTVAPRGG